MIKGSKSILVSNKGQLKVILKILTSAPHMLLDIEHTNAFDTQVKSWHCESQSVKLAQWKIFKHSIVTKWLLSIINMMWKPSVNAACGILLVKTWLMDKCAIYMLVSIIAQGWCEKRPYRRNRKCKRLKKAYPLSFQLTLICTWCLR